MTNHRVVTGNKARKARNPAEQVKTPGLDHDTRRMMENWARWACASDEGHSMPMTNAYDMGGAGRRDYDKPEPLINGDAIDTDRAVRTLPDELRVVIVQYWTRRGTALQKARACRCHVATFWRRLHHAHVRINDYRRIIRQRSARVAAALGGGCQSPCQTP